MLTTADLPASMRADFTDAAPTPLVTPSTPVLERRTMIGGARVAEPA